MTPLSTSRLIIFNKTKIVFHISNRKYKLKKMYDDLSVTKNLSDNLKQIFDKSVTAVKPQSLINNCFEVKRSLDCEIINAICVNDHEISITHKNVKIIGFGKAVFGMAVQIQNKLQSVINGGILSIPVGTLDTFKNDREMVLKDNIKIFEGALNNIADENSSKAGKEIFAYLNMCSEDDLVIVLISGGGSALLTCPKDNITYTEKASLIKKLANRGANIGELNTIRKRLSRLKGGKLSETAFPAQVVALVLSDVIGDPLDVIASGPTVPNEDSPEAAKNIIERYGLGNELSDQIREYIYDTSKKPSQNLTNTSTYIIGNNQTAVDAAAAEASEKGYIPVILSTEVQGNVNTISKIYKDLVLFTVKYISKKITGECFKSSMSAALSALKSAPSEFILRSLDAFKKSKGVCFILGGEPTIVVSGKGAGGRNQHLALQLAEDLHDVKNDLDGFDVVFMSAGTDGIDGPTDAAGAISFTSLFEEADKCKIDARQYILNNDSNTFYKQFADGEYLIVTGHTGTNVMDVHGLIIAKKQ